jgi:peptidoglycan lytic transglycosylase
MTRPQIVLRAVAATAAGGAFIAGAPLAVSADRAAARAANATSRPGAGDLAIARRRLNVVAGRRAVVSGHVAGAAGRTVTVERRRGSGWAALARDRTDANGRFAVRFRPRDPGSAQVRVRSGGDRRRVGRLNVFRHAQASWYGPGLYGGHLGCGGTLTPGTLGVANKTLPCGAKVTLRHRGRIVRVPVVDRGPYSGGREFDLTAATKNRLGFSGAGTILVAD